MGGRSWVIGEIANESTHTPTSLPTQMSEESGGSKERMLFILIVCALCVIAGIVCLVWCYCKFHRSYQARDSPTPQTKNSYELWNEEQEPSSVAP